MATSGLQRARWLAWRLSGRSGRAFSGAPSRKRIPSGKNSANTDLHSRWDRNWTQNFEVLRVADVVWAYLQIVKHYHSGIPTGKSHFVKVFDREGASATISTKKKVAPDLLQSIQRRVPWAIYSFSPGLEQMWKKRRAEFLLGVDQQKRKTQAPSAQTKPAIDKKELVRV